MGTAGAGVSMALDGFTFATEGVAGAVAPAQAGAGAKNAGAGGANIPRQCLQAGLLDELSIALAPILLGQGIPLFRYLGIEPVRLESRRARPAPGVTHLTFRVVR